MVLYIIWY